MDVLVNMFENRSTARYFIQTQVCIVYSKMRLSLSVESCTIVVKIGKMRYGFWGISVIREVPLGICETLKRDEIVTRNRVVLISSTWEVAK